MTQFFPNYFKNVLPVPINELNSAYSKSIASTSTKQYVKDTYNFTEQQSTGKLGD